MKQLAPESPACVASLKRCRGKNHENDDLSSFARAGLYNLAGSREWEGGPWIKLLNVLTSSPGPAAS